MAAKTKLELTWIGKENRPRLEPRILIEEERLSHHATARRDGDKFNNVLIRGDNLLGLKALEATHTGSVKCIYIDPPYNTGSAFTLYDDSVEHSLWLGLLRERVSVLHRLLSDDGSIWISIDDREGHYLKVLMDEIFGRANFVANVIWQKKFSAQNDAKWLSDVHEHILVYARNKEIWRPNRLPIATKTSTKRSNADDDARGAWISVDYTCNKNRQERPRLYYPIKNPNTGEEVWPKETAVWRFSPETHAKNVEEGLVYWGKKGTNSVPRYKNFKAVEATDQVPTTLWLHEDVGNTQEAKKEAVASQPDQPFPTPKPERLIERILQIATNPGDLVLDSFAGSGTTGAVAHKMGRRWIMVELGDHCETHIVPRLNKVINGEDSGGITEAVSWKGGGGYRYYKLAPSLLEKDQFDNWVISKSYNPAMLAEAMCKHFGFAYAPSDEHYWMHGHSSETDFIYVTTNSLTHEQLAAISDEVGPERTLLICCRAFQGGNADAFGNLTIRKIPGAILDRCEWGKDDYSLKIEALPLIEDEPEGVVDEAPRRKSVGNPNQPGLFNGDEEGEA
ncbi:site-specific DNA-methyltransferase [Brevundimonas sp. UBA7664]|uniref:site-specific DNA-methyltransferase n=1 Tax=Brevundimonas sp. UBA7664 TaxID=1946141 RepID=UPI0025BB6C75|nr:site-specific DNA-methyltransferase [Brevundimonas sp. UBA7664]